VKRNVNTDIKTIDREIKKKKTEEHREKRKRKKKIENGKY
jgi:hypothetical protein